MKSKSLWFFLIFYLFSFSPVLAATFSAKKGVAGAYYPSPVLKTIPKLRYLGANWFYNWDINPNLSRAAKTNCLQYIPMARYLWGDTDDQKIKDNIDAFFNNPNNAYTPGSYWLIGNEPDQSSSGGSDLTRITGDRVANPDTTLLNKYVTYAAYIKTHDQFAKFIIGGFITAGDYTSTTQTRPPAYSQAFILKNSFAAAGIAIKGWHIHMYNCCGAIINDTNNFLKSLRLWKNYQISSLGGGETWITEMGDLHNTAGMREWMTSVVNYLETHYTTSNVKVDKYAWFTLPTYLNDDGVTMPYGDCGLYRPNESPSLLGIRYASLPASSTATPRPCGAASPRPTVAPTPTPITTQPGWNLITLSENRNNIFNNCSVSSKRDDRWKIITTIFDTIKPYYAKCY